MRECLACESMYEGNTEYCSPECETVFEASIKESIESAKVIGLIDSEGNSILGNAYQQNLRKQVQEAAAKIGIKLPPKE